MNAVSNAGLALLLATASLANPAAQNRRNLAAGAGAVTSNGEEVTFGLAVNSGPNGENPRGFVTLDWPSGTAQFSVDCFGVGGNRAVIGGSGPRGNILLIVQDDGEPGANIDGFYVVPGQACGGVIVGDPPLQPISRGNIQVIDAI